MKRNVLIIGGSPAGLTAALRLSRQGYRVTILEPGNTWGGRGLHTTADPVQADAFPTVVLGWHHATLGLLKLLGTAKRVPFSSNLSFEFATSALRPVRLARPFLPAPWCTLLSIATFRGLSLRDRWHFLNWLERTWEQDPALPADLDHHIAEAWFRGIGQSERARRQIWTPLSRFLLGDDLRTVSAAVFLNTLIRCFMSSRQHSLLAVPSDNLSGLLVDPAIKALRQAGVAMRLDAPISQIHINPQGVTGVQLHDAETITADWYVAALPHRALSPLLPERAVTRFSYFQQLSQLRDSASLTVHLRIERRIARPRLLLLADRSYHWTVLRPDPLDNRYLLASFVATGQPDLLERPDPELVDLVLTDLQAALPDSQTAHLSDHRIVREPRAFLSVRPGATALRPLQQSPFSNFFLAGDWTDTGLPSTLESAIFSGEVCAQAIASKLG